MPTIRTIGGHCPPYCAMRKIIVGVMGPGADATAADLAYAYELGKLIAQQGWVLLTGGRNVGVMEGASQGAKAANGLTIGILPTDDTNGISEAVDIAIITDMGNARNNINVLSSNNAKSWTCRFNPLDHHMKGICPQVTGSKNLFLLDYLSWNTQPDG